MRRSGLFLLLLLCLVVNGLAGVKFELVLPDQGRGASSEGLHAYNFVNSFYTDVLLVFGLIDQFSLEEKATIAKQLFTNLSETDPERLIIKRYVAGKDLQIIYRILPEVNGKRAVALITNYHAKTKSIVTQANVAEAYARLYYIRGSRLVARDYIFSKELEDSKQGSLNDLADLYIFDDVEENDARIEDSSVNISVLLKRPPANLSEH